MASSIPAATDYLVTEIAKLPECQLPVRVSDGWPQPGEVQVVIGIDPDDGDSDVEVNYSQLDGKDAEAVELPCAILVHESGSSPQKPARDKAFEIYDAIRALIKTDPRFGGAILTGLPARVVRYRASQTAVAKEAGEGRSCDINFTIAWTHRG